MPGLPARRLEVVALVRLEADAGAVPSLARVDDALAEELVSSAMLV